MFSTFFSFYEFSCVSALLIKHSIPKIRMERKLEKNTKGLVLKGTIRESEEHFVKETEIVNVAHS